MGRLISMVLLSVVIHTSLLAQDQQDTLAADQVKFPLPGKFHQMLALSNGIWIGEGSMQFSSDGQRVNSGVARLVNKMSSDGLYQISEIKGNIKPGGMGAPWTGLRITGYDSAKGVFTRAMIGDGPAIEPVSMQGQWDEAKRTITFPFRKVDNSGKEQKLTEVYTIVDNNTEILEIYATDPKTSKEFMMLQVRWTRQNNYINGKAFESSSAAADPATKKCDRKQQGQRAEVNLRALPDLQSN